MTLEADPPFGAPEIAAWFARCDAAQQRGLLHLRRLIFEEAQRSPRVGHVAEALRWGQPAYLTPETGAGSTLRLGVLKDGGFALYAHCRTTLISEFRDQYPDDFRFEGNRAVLFRDDDDIRADRLRVLIGRALSYHLRGRAK